MSFIILYKYNTTIYYNCVHLKKIKMPIRIMNIDTILRKDIFSW